MGILNITPNSFSDGGNYLDEDAAAQRLRLLIDDGADIIDIGAESTGPGSSPTSSKIEIERLQNIFSRPEIHQTCVSVDTYRSETAAFCLERGAQIINDVSGLRADPEMASTIAKHKASVVIMFSKQDANTPNVTSEAVHYEDIIKTIAEFFSDRIAYAMDQGIDKNNVILDPGLGGFVSAEAQYSWEIIRRLPELREQFQEYSLLIGTSRKGFLGGDVGSRDPISQLTSMMAYSRGVRVIRTHNVAMARQFYMAWSLVESQSFPSD